MNNPISNDLPWQEPVKYAIWQREIGESGTPHLQGYVECTKRMTLNQMKKLVPELEGAHWETRKGRRDQARDYCRKEESRAEGPWEFGDWAARAGSQGERSDLLELHALAKAGTRTVDVMEMMPAAYMRYAKQYAHVASLYAKVEYLPREVVVHYGPTGAGKTRLALASDDLWMKPACDSNWYDGYVGQETAVIDEFTGQMSLHTLLRLLDCYKFFVPVKGGFTQWSPRVVIITTNFHPRQWYDWCPNGKSREASWPPLCRRITKVIDFTGPAPEELVGADKERWLDAYPDPGSAGYMV